MDGISNLLGKLSFEDVEKLKVLMSLMSEGNTREVITLRVFSNEYKTLVKNNKSVSYLRSVSISLNYLEKFFGAQKIISSINLRDIENFLQYLQQNDKSDKQYKRRSGNGYVVYYRNLKAAFNKAIDWGYIKENYFIKVKLPKRQRTAPEFINRGQLSAISRQIKNEAVRNVVVLAFYTGMRLDEIVNLRWKNVDLKEKIITVGDELFVTKGRNQRFIPICDEAYEVLMKVKYNPPLPLPGGDNPPLPLPGGDGFDPAYINVSEGKLSLLRGDNGSVLYNLPDGNKNEFVFCKSNGKKFTGGYFTKSFKRACKAAGVKKEIHFHTLRHSFASNLAQQGVSLYKIKELLGHSSITTTEIYAHLNIDSLREAIKTLDEIIPHPKSLTLVRKGTFKTQQPLVRRGALNGKAGSK